MIVQQLLNQFFEKDLEMFEDNGLMLWYVKDDFLVKIDEIQFDSAHLTESQDSVIFYDRDAEHSISADLTEEIVAHVYKKVTV